VHAAGESSPGKLPSGTFAVVLQAELPELLNLEQKLTASNIPFRSIRENDPPFEGELMAIGVQPGERRNLKKYFSRLQLLR